MPPTDALIDLLVVDPAVLPYTRSLHRLSAHMAKRFPDRKSARALHKPQRDRSAAA